MINKPTCYKNPDRPSFIDLILTNCPHSFQNSCVIETFIKAVRVSENGSNSNENSVQKIGAKNSVLSWRQVFL